MDQQTNQILFALLRSAVCGIKLTDTELEQFHEERLGHLLSLAKKHDLSHLLVLALEHNHLLAKEATETKKLLFQAVYRCEQLNYEYERICKALETAKIPYIPLKGSVLRKYYPEAWMRTSCDIDILVNTDDLQCAIDTLVERLEYQCANRTNYHNVSLHAKNGVHLELHFHIRENIENVDPLLSKVWQYVQPETANGLRYLQTPEYFVFHHLAHMSYHFVHGGCGVRPFLDMYILKKNMDFDEAILRGYCRQCGIEDFYQHVLEMVDVWFDNATHTPLTCRIEDYILRGGVYGSLENKVMVAQSKHGGKTGYLLSRIFLPYDSLKNYYPILSKHKWLLPFMHIIRWMRVLFCGRLPHGVHEMKTNQHIPSNSSDEMRIFLKDIGL